MVTKRAWILILIVIPGLSCEKKVSFTTESLEPKLVVEATIEEGAYPVVRLTNSLDYFSEITPEQLIGSFIRNAEITVSNGVVTHTLKEYNLNAGGYDLYYYTVDSSESTAFRGLRGESYTLKIKSDGKEYESVTQIPNGGRTLDNLEFEAADDDKDSTKVILYGEFTDPPGFGNYTRYFTSTNDESFFPGLNSVNDDQIIDGKQFRLPIDKGVDRNSDIDYEEYAFFHKGDTVAVKYSCIDKGVFDFWRTMEYAYGSIGNPFSSPTKVLGNITGGALGYFGGYSVAYKGLRIPE